MRYSQENIENAYKLHQVLLTKGELKKESNPDLFRLYFEQDVREILQKIFLPIDEAEILFVDQTLYFVPNIDNEMFSFSNQELREKLKFKDNKQLYLARFIWINVIAEFYGEQYMITNEPRSFVKVEEIYNKVKDYIAKFDKLDDELKFDLSAEYGMDLEGLVDAWSELAEVTSKVKDVRKAVTRDVGFIHKVLNYWEKEDLVYLVGEAEIVLTPKMKNIIGNYYNQETRINEIKDLLNRVDALTSKEVQTI